MPIKSWIMMITIMILICAVLFLAGCAQLGRVDTGLTAIKAAKGEAKSTIGKIIDAKNMECVQHMCYDQTLASWQRLAPAYWITLPPLCRAENASWMMPGGMQ